jgi:site-specific recombinase XerD
MPAELTVSVISQELAARVTALVVDSVTSPRSTRSYAEGIAQFLDWFRATQPATGFTRATVQAWRAALVAAGLAPATVNLRLTVIRRLAAEAAENGLLPIEVASAINRVKGLNPTFVSQRAMSLWCSRQKLGQSVKL